MILGIDWNVQSRIFKDYETPNLYGLLFVTGLIVGYFVIKRMFKAERIPDTVLDKLLIFVVLATIIGARLGHVFFYGPYRDAVDANGDVIRGYLDHPEDIFKVWEGGLASHGAAILILIVLYWFSRKVVKRPMFWVLDRVVAPIAIAGCCIRLGNLVNHEMVGIPTDLPWGFRFSRVDDVYRHPAQLYEAICYLITFFVLVRMYWKTNAKAIPGRIFGAFMILIWTARFTIEFIKIGQNEFDNNAEFLNTGQILSVPFILIGLFLYFRKVPQKEQERFTAALNTPMEEAQASK